VVRYSTAVCIVVPIAPGMLCLSTHVDESLVMPSWASRCQINSRHFCAVDGENARGSSTKPSRTNDAIDASSRGGAARGLETRCFLSGGGVDGAAGSLAVHERFISNLEDLEMK